ncbi:COG1896: Predicted hydrolases of HD superfamily [hydrothermal vent metagenome]|uniref:COG1896: Predicted hydrolases of HD superfamily n=1 Tax=hydrothermal vent metagenome TaxID=652676 RepID=A0A3B0T706_9ZZZZ
MATTKPPRAWQRMLSGRRLDLLDPSPLDVEIEDIAHGLARMARWNGQTTGAHAFSVAQHALLVEEITRRTHPGWPAKWQLAALLHDAAEYVIGDLISPFKAAIGLDYKTFENALLAAIHVRFGLPPAAPKTISRAIKSADRIAAFLEATQLAGFSQDEAAKIFGPPKDLAGGAPDLTPQSPTDIQVRYLARFGELLARL